MRVRLVLRKDRVGKEYDFFEDFVEPLCFMIMLGLIGFGLLVLVVVLLC